MIFHAQGHGVLCYFKKVRKKKKEKKPHTVTEIKDKYICQ